MHAYLYKEYLCPSMCTCIKGPLAQGLRPALYAPADGVLALVALLIDRPLVAKIVDSTIFRARCSKNRPPSCCQNRRFDDFRARVFFWGKKLHLSHSKSERLKKRKAASRASCKPGLPPTNLSFSHAQGIGRRCAIRRYLRRSCL